MVKNTFVTSVKVLNKEQLTKNKLWLKFFSHKQRRSVPVDPHLCQHDLSVVLLMLDILTSEKWILRGILICSSLMDKVIEHFS